MAIVLENVSFDNFKNINMQFDSNCIYTIYDESSSELLALLSLIRKPENGKLIIQNFTYQNSTKKIPQKVRKKLGYVSKFCEEQFFSLTVKEELEIALKLLKVKYDISDLINCMEMVNLDPELLDHDPFTLSNGEKRKLAIASILVYNPDILILDNPFIGLDCDSAKNLYKLIRKLKTDYQKTIIIVTNDIEVAYKISDYVYMIKENEIILEGERSIIYEKKDILIENNILLPKLVSFSDYVFQSKNIKLRYRYEINDLIKDIYRNA